MYGEITPLERPSQCTMMEYRPNGLSTFCGNVANQHVTTYDSYKHRWIMNNICDACLSKANYESATPLHLPVV